MTPPAAVVLAVTVWGIGLIPSVRVRALVYSLPVPMSLVLAGGSVRVDGVQVVGVLLLVVFFAVVTLLHVRLGWPAVVAVVAGAAGYVGVAWALPSRLPLAACVAVVSGLWLAGALLRPRGARPARVRPARAWPVVVGKLGAVLVATFGMVGLSGLLAGFIVTFPYSGVLVAVEARRELVAFTWAFARASLGLVGFVVGFAAGQDHGTGVGLAVGWAAYGVCAVVLHRTAGSPAAALPATDPAHRHTHRGDRAERGGAEPRDGGGA